MILADTSIWIDHLNAGDVLMAQLLDRAEILVHPFVVGELAMGSFRHRKRAFKTLRRLPEMIPVRHSEVIGFVNSARLYGRGIGYVDAHLLAAVRLRPSVRLWTRDHRLRLLASELGLRADLP